MNSDVVLELAQQTIWTTILVGGPLLVIALIVGLMVGMFQAATQINEMTLTFVPKMAILFATLLIFGPWMLATLVNFSKDLIARIPFLIG